LAAASELAGRLESGGLAVAAPSEHPVHGVAESRWVAPGGLVAAAEAARAAGFFFESMTCVDRLDPHGVFELLYTFNRWDEFARFAVRVWAPKDEAVPSLSGVFGIAAWNEREAWEFYGLRFSGHPNLTWLLLPEETEFHPLLKSFTAPPPSIYDDSLNPPAPADAGGAHDHAHG
jgi:NADH-quinone oxidoreductase subunit C